MTRVNKIKGEEIRAWEEKDKGKSNLVKFYPNLKSSKSLDSKLSEESQTIDLDKRHSIWSLEFNFHDK